MYRRSFLKNAGSFGLALGLYKYLSPFEIMSGDEVQPDEKDMFFKLSLAQWSFHKSIMVDKTLDPLDFAAKAKTLGFDAVEYVNQLYNIDQANKAASIDKLVKELKTRSADQGVTNVLIMIDGEGELSAVSKVARDESIDRHSRWVDGAALLGCHAIRVNLFGTGAETDFNIWKETSVDGLGRLAQYAAKNNINVIVENHGGLSSDAGKLIEVIKTINLKNCGTLPDFGNFCIRREAREGWGSACTEEYDKYKGVQEMMPFAHGVSAKTFDFDDKGNETTIDYYKMLKIVKEAGYTGRIGIEYEGSRLNEEDGIKATRALLLKAAAKLK